MTLAVISPKKPSTRLSQEEEVGMKMEVKTGMTLKPGGDFGVLGGRIVVANNVKLQLGGDFLVDLAQEGEPLLMAMARGGVGKHLAGKVVQGGKEGYRSVPVVVMGPGANVSLAQRQSGLGAFESLSLALFIAAEHQGLLGRVEIEAHDVPEFFLKPKVFAELEIAHPVGLQLMGRPESLHARFAQAGFTGHSAHTPRPTVRSPGARDSRPLRQPWPKAVACVPSQGRLGDPQSPWPPSASANLQWPKDSQTAPWRSRRGRVPEPTPR